jgi:crotonobetainyl-CoA:carnitine CoA-transferase CaiB-like acyl-CoA transferase
MNEDADTMPLAGLRVLEIGSAAGLEYCGKLFADFGADVIKAEPPGGDPRRAIPPVLDVGGGRSESGTFAWLNTNKRSMTADAACLRALLGDADVLLDARPPAETEQGPLGHAGLCAAHPGLTIVALSWFGESGPYRDFAASDATVRALAGLVHLVGPVEGPPILASPDGQAGYLGGLAAFIAAASGLLGRERGSRRFEVSTLEAVATVSEYETAVALSGLGRRRNGVNRFGRNYPVTIYPTKQGLLGVTVVTPAQWRGFCAMVGRADLVEDARFSANVDRIVYADELDAIFAPILAERTAAEWFRLGLHHKLPLCIVPTVGDLLGQAIHRERGVFAPVRIGEATFQAQVVPQRLTRTPPRRGGTAPLAGTHAGGWASTPAAAWLPASGPAAAGSLPLAGLRIIDLTMGWAGPSATRHLGDLGAEIVKVEACQYPDWWRGTDKRTAFFEQKLYEKSYWYHAMNRNKLGVTLDLTTAEGKHLFKRLVAGADAVIENYSVEVLPKLGLDYAALRAVKPDLVMVSMPAFGTGNAWSTCRAYGSTLEQASGLPTLTGSPGGPPTMNHTAYGDPVGGFNAAAALLIALLHRKRTGEGQFVDISQVECMMPMVAPALIAQSALGTTPPRSGNRHPIHAPQGAFRCVGEDAWIVVTVTSEAAWRGLCGVLGREDLAGLDAAARHARADEIEAAIGVWAAAHTADSAMTALQGAGVPAGAARSPLDLTRDPHLRARGFWREADNAFMGRHLHTAAPFREGAAPYPLARPSPTLGQHNGEVLGGILGLGPAEIARLSAAGVIGTEAVPKGRIDAGGVSS